MSTVVMLRGGDDHGMWCRIVVVDVFSRRSRLEGGGSILSWPGESAPSVWVLVALKVIFQNCFAVGGRYFTEQGDLEIEAALVKSL